MIPEYQNILIEHWCDNPECEEVCKDPDSSEGLRYVFDGNETLNDNCCVVCKNILTSRLEIIRVNLLIELKIPFKL